MRLLYGDGTAATNAAVADVGRVEDRRSVDPRTGRRPKKRLRGTRGLTVAVLVVAALGCSAAARDGGDEVTLRGSFVWALEEGDRDGELEAVLSPTGDGRWTVVFNFVWEDVSHTYYGTASGSLSGALEGTARETRDDPEVSYRFEGNFDEGTFSGTHGWVHENGSFQRSGTLTLSRAR